MAAYLPVPATVMIAIRVPFMALPAVVVIAVPVPFTAVPVLTVASSDHIKADRLILDMMRD
jgi:hypothetical protein